MERCGLDDHHDDKISAPDHRAAALARADTHDPVPVIHCASLSEPTGPAARAASAEMRRSDKPAALAALCFLSALLDPRPKIMWLQAVFRNNSAVAHHLFLSVLQI